jgi:hypothetical protein
MEIEILKDYLHQILFQFENLNQLSVEVTHVASLAELDFERLWGQSDAISSF